jgi:hypothetical protein
LCAGDLPFPFDDVDDDYQWEVIGVEVAKEGLHLYGEVNDLDIELNTST